MPIPIGCWLGSVAVVIGFFVRGYLAMSMAIPRHSGRHVYRPGSRTNVHPARRHINGLRLGACNVCCQQCS